MSAGAVGGLRPSRTLVRAAGGAVAAIVLATGLIGFAHTPAGRPLLRYLPGMGACPLGLDARLSPLERESRRSAALEPLLGTRPAPARPALGFTLLRSQRTDVLAWASSQGVECASRRDGAELVCPHVAGAALGPEAAGLGADDLLFAFDPRGALVAVDAVRRGLDAAGAARFLAQRAEELTHEVGAPSRTSGEATAAYLARGTVAAASVEFQFSDYVATVDAAQLGGLGLLVRESYRAATPPLARR